MASHSVSVLVKLANDVHACPIPDAFRLAMQWLRDTGSNPGLMEIDYVQWKAMHKQFENVSSLPGDLPAIDALYNEILQALGTQVTTWIALGRPATHEAWMGAMQYKEYEVVQTRTVNLTVTVKLLEGEVPEDKDKLDERLETAAFDEILDTLMSTKDILIDYLTLDDQSWKEVE